MKARWGITSNWRFAKILFIFAATGMSAVQVRKLLFPLIGITDMTAIWIKIIVWIVLLTPVYYLFMVFYAVLFGEREFFFGMMKKTFSRFRRKEKEKTPPEDRV